MPARPALILFARAPTPGEVKTRLVPRLGPEGAAALYQAFLTDAGRMYCRPERWTSVLCAATAEESPGLDACFSGAWARRTQAVGDLGRKLAEAFDAEFRLGAPEAVAVGSDHPALPVSRLEQAFEMLASGVGAVVVPADDGGYCAIGLRAGVPLEMLFGGVAWSTETVLATTLERLSEAGVSYRVLAPSYDVDRPEDLERLRRDLEARDCRGDDFPAATAAALRVLAGAAP